MMRQPHEPPPRCYSRDDAAVTAICGTTPHSGERVWQEEASEGALPLLQEPLFRELLH